MANESIESRLSAYIDGLLDAEQREQIEEYLDRYPEHRQLIDQLIQERTILRDLPRQSAPPDIDAHFQGQLERAALLDDFPVRGATGHHDRRGRWSVAVLLAIVLLAAVVGVIAWIAMPPQRTNRAQNLPAVEPLPVASTLPATTEPVVAVSATEPATQPAPAPSGPWMHASVAHTDDRIIVMVMTNDLSAAHERANTVLQSLSLSRSGPATQPASTQPSTSPSTTETSSPWLLPAMTKSQTEKFADLINSPVPSPASSQPSSENLPTSQPTTHPSTQPTVPAIVIFQETDFRPENASHPGA